MRVSQAAGGAGAIIRPDNFDDVASRADAMHPSQR
jgi:hypothetical protein